MRPADARLARIEFDEAKWVWGLSCVEPIRPIPITGSQGWFFIQLAEKDVVQVSKLVPVPDVAPESLRSKKFARAWMAGFRAGVEEFGLKISVVSPFDARQMGRREAWWHGYRAGKIQAWKAWGEL